MIMINCTFLCVRWQNLLNKKMDTFPFPNGLSLGIPADELLVQLYMFFFSWLIYAKNIRHASITVADISH